MSVAQALQRAKNKGWIDPASRGSDTEFNDVNIKCIPAEVVKTDLAQDNKSSRKCDEQLVVHGEPQKVDFSESKDVDHSVVELFAKLLAEETDSCKEGDKDSSHNSGLRSAPAMIDSKYDQPTNQKHLKNKQSQIPRDFDSASSQEKWLRWKSGESPTNPNSVQDKIDQSEKQKVSNKEPFVFGSKVSFSIGTKPVKNVKQNSKVATKCDNPQGFDTSIESTQPREGG